VAALTLGRSIVGFVTCFAGFVGGIFKFRCLGAVVAGAASTIFYAIVVTGSAISNATLVFGMVEGNSAGFGIDLNFGRAVVGNNIGSDTNECNHDHDRNKLFHLLSPHQGLNLKNCNFQSFPYLLL